MSTAIGSSELAQHQGYVHGRDDWNKAAGVGFAVGSDGAAQNSSTAMPSV